MGIESANTAESMGLIGLLDSMTQRVTLPPNKDMGDTVADTGSNGFERVNDALRNLDDQLQELRERFDEQYRRLESTLRERGEELRSQLDKSTLARRTREVRRDIEERVEQQRTRLYDAFGIASKSEIQKLNRKVSTLSKKLKELAQEDRFPAPEPLAGETESEVRGGIETRDESARESEARQAFTS